MSWVNDLASGLGIPAGVATLAVAMYLGCSAAEKAARPEALQDIGRILKDPSWSRSVRPSAIIGQIFVWTFGERHLSRICVLSCAIASIYCISAAVLVLHFGTGTVFASPPTRFGFKNPAVVAYYYFGCGLIAFCSDYLALAKTRWLMRLLARSEMDVLGGVAVALLDVLLSCMTVAAVTLVLMSVVHLLFYSMSGIFTRVLFTSLGWVFAAPSDGAITEAIISRDQHFLPSAILAIVNSASAPFVGSSTSSAYSAFIWSTILTSIWSVSTILATTVLKLLAPLHRFTAWFFDVEKHPVQAIGIVAGALVMIGSLVWSIVRAAV